MRSTEEWPKRQSASRFPAASDPDHIIVWPRETHSSGDFLATSPIRTPRSMPRRPIERPHTDCYVVPGTRIVAGSYAGVHPDHPPAVLDNKLNALLDSGITASVDLI